MNASSVRSIVHPTDLSEASQLAFVHALRIALAARCRLHILHIGGDDVDPDAAFPPVRSLLANWRLMRESDPPSAVGELLGLRVSKCAIAAPDIFAAIPDYLDEHPSDLLVLGTEGRTGLRRIQHGSMAERIARAGHASTLFLRAEARGFVSPSTGSANLRRILAPIDPAIEWRTAWNVVTNLAALLNPAGADIRFLHVGERPAEPGRGPISELLEYRSGPVVETIIEAAGDIDADLIVMPTEGRHGVLDALRGSTSERVLRLAPCPVLAIPARAAAT